MDQPRLVSLFDLLRKGYTPAQLATAVEKHGVTGWDRFGRFGPFKPTSDGARSALDALAAYQSALNDAYERADQELANLEPGDPYPGLDDPLDLLTEHTHTVSLHHFGWPRDKLPPIDRTVQHPPPPTRKISPRSANETLNALGALLLVLDEFRRSNLGIRIPLENALIASIVEKYPRFPGCGESTLKDKFAISKQIVEREAAVLKT